MKIKILLFAHLKEEFGRADLVWDASDGETVGSVVEKFALCHKVNSLQSTPLLYAVNEAFTDKTKVLKEGDTLACLAPMSGGAA